MTSLLILGRAITFILIEGFKPSTRHLIYYNIEVPERALDRSWISLSVYEIFYK